MGWSLNKNDIMITSYNIIYESQSQGRTSLVLVVGRRVRVREVILAEEEGREPSKLEEQLPLEVRPGEGRRIREKSRPSNRQLQLESTGQGQKKYNG